MSAPDNFCPYVGLQPFTEKDNAFFFGRERDQRIITSNLYAAPLTVMYGASGVGKSSILMAGVVPTLRAKSRTAVVVYRNWQDSNFHADFKAQILADLQAAQKKSLAINPALPLDDFLADACEKFGGTIFILLDQFEEYFLYQPETRGTESFDAELARAINRTDVEASFLFSLREDALSKLDRFRARIPNLLGNTLRLNHLDAAAAEIAIRKPLEVYNARYPDRALKIEDALVTEIIAQVRTGKVVMGSGGSGASQSSQTTAQIETPFLQLVLTRLWEEEMQIIARAKTHPTEKTVSTRQRLTDSLMLSLKPKTTLEHAGVLELATLKRLGGAEQIVRTHLDGVMGKLTATEQDICSNFFDRLVTPSGAKIAQINADLVKWAARPPEQVTPILKALVDARVLRTVAPPIDQPTAIRYEIFHDVLGPAVLDWRRRFVETQRQIRERARLRRLRLTAFGAIALTLIFGVLSIFALYQRGAAEDARAVAVDQRNDAQRANEESIVRLLMTQSRETLTSNPARSVLLALEALHLVNEFGFGTPSFFNNIQTADDTLRRAVFTSRGFALPAHTDIVYTVAISPDNRWFASASRDKTVRLWNVAQVLKFDQNGIAQNASQILRGNEKDVRVLEFTPDSRWLITASDDGNARMYDLRASDPNASQIILKGHTKEIRSLAISKDGHYLVTGSNDKTARVWDLRATNPAANPILLTGHSDPLFGVAVSPNSRWVATASDDNTARIYDLTAREPNGAVTILRGHTDQVSVISFSPDGHWLVTGSADATARVWDMTAPNPAVAVKILRGHEEPVLALAFAPDSSLLATGGFDTTARLWDLNATDPSAKQIVLRGHSDQILSLAFTTDRRFLITASRDSTMAMWDLTMPDPTIAPIILHGHEGAVRQVAVSTDGKLLLSAGEDNIVRITGVTVPLSPITPIILSGHSSVARAVQFSNDGKWLATGSGDSTVRLWQMNTDDPGGNVIVLR
ncbi:MAG: hypothetical protein HY257_07100, partial [Chloroflexi bacterium]|nr:hypothetical protein [Chloroflexota bacterium]